MKEVKEEAQGSAPAEGAVEKVCYDANRSICICEAERSGVGRQTFFIDEECASSLSFVIRPCGTPSC
jgi:hypothetical protein